MKVAEGETRKPRMIAPSDSVFGAGLVGAGLEVDAPRDYETPVRDDVLPNCGKHTALAGCSEPSRRQLNIARRLMTVVISVGALGAVGAHAAGINAPLPYEQEGVVYMSGGTAEGDIAAMRKVAPGYQLELLFDFKPNDSSGRDSPVVGAMVEIRDSVDNLVLKAVTNGPLFLVKLPAGVYDVKVSYRGRQYEKRAVVDPPQRERLVFGAEAGG